MYLQILALVCLVRGQSRLASQHRRRFEYSEHFWIVKSNSFAKVESRKGDLPLSVCAVQLVLENSSIISVACSSGWRLHIHPASCALTISSSCLSRCLRALVWKAAPYVLLKGLTGLCYLISQCLCKFCLCSCFFAVRGGKLNCFAPSYLGKGVGSSVGSHCSSSM